MNELIMWSKNCRQELQSQKNPRDAESPLMFNIQYFGKFTFLLTHKGQSGCQFISATTPQLP